MSRSRSSLSSHASADPVHRERILNIKGRTPPSSGPYRPGYYSKITFMFSLWWLAFVCAGHTIAITSILFRLYSNLVSGRLWWDEPFYVVAATFNLVLGSLFLTHIHGSPQEPFHNATYILSLNAYFMVIWIMRAGVLTSFVHVLLSVTDRVRAEATLTFILVLTGVGFSIGSTVTCIAQGQVQQLSLTFTVIAIASDVLADTYTAVRVYMTVMVTLLRPSSKFFILAGFYGPLSVMIVATTSWILSLTILSSNIRTQICMLNITASYYVAMSSIPVIIRCIFNYVYRSSRSRSSETSLIEMYTPMEFRSTGDTIINHGLDEQDNQLSEAVLTTARAVVNHILSFSSLEAITDDSSHSKSGSLPLHSS